MCLWKVEAHSYVPHFDSSVITNSPRWLGLRKTIEHEASGAESKQIRGWLNDDCEMEETDDDFIPEWNQTARMTGRMRIKGRRNEHKSKPILQLAWRANTIERVNVHWWWLPVMVVSWKLNAAQRWRRWDVCDAQGFEISRSKTE